MTIKLSARALRTVELIFVLVAAFALPSFQSLYVLFAGQTASFNPELANVSLLRGITVEVFALGILTYVLFRQSRSYAAIGLAPRWQDIPWSIVVMILAYLMIQIVYAIIFNIYYVPAGTAPETSSSIDTVFSSGSLFLSIPFVLINPIYEEVIVRAYTISEIEYLTGSARLAIFTSVAIQMIYHLYQGLPNAISLAAGFFVFSLYYQKTRSITPVILAHFYFDMLALAHYARW